MKLTLAEGTSRLWSLSSWGSGWVSTVRGCGTATCSTASPPVAVLAAASQRTSRIELGTAVIPLGWENPLRLAEDLASVDVLSGGRLNPGVSVGPPMHWDDVQAALYPDTAEQEDFGYARVERLLRMVRGEPT